MSHLPKYTVMYTQHLPEYPYQNDVFCARILIFGAQELALVDTSGMDVSGTVEDDIWLRILVLILWLEQDREKKSSSSGRNGRFLYCPALVSLQYEHKSFEYNTLATSSWLLEKIRFTIAHEGSITLSQLLW